MSSSITEILQSKRKPKEKVTLLTETIKKDSRLFGELIDVFKTGSDVDKGTCAEVMQQVSKDHPEIVFPYLDMLIEYINYKAPRVKWGVPESIGNLAQKYPAEVAKAIPNLLINTREESTVVRWCAAFALAEIAKYNIAARENLIPLFMKFVEEEKNNGVKNVYVKALKFIGRR
ncbi:MAG: hypothetical protein MUC94_12735 [bacterium]|jgi:hypothetical protein|nr:hypothetical protein [bacterium]